MLSHISRIDFIRKKVELRQHFPHLSWLSADLFHFVCYPLTSANHGLCWHGTINQHLLTSCWRPMSNYATASKVVSYIVAGIQVGVPYQMIHSSWSSVKSICYLSTFQIKTPLVVLGTKWPEDDSLMKIGNWHIFARWHYLYFDSPNWVHFVTSRCEMTSW